MAVARRCLSLRCPQQPTALLCHSKMDVFQREDNSAKWPSLIALPSLRRRPSPSQSNAVPLSIAPLPPSPIAITLPLPSPIKLPSLRHCPLPQPPSIPIVMPHIAITPLSCHLFLHRRHRPLQLCPRHCRLPPPLLFMATTTMTIACRPPVHCATTAVAL